MRPSPYMTMRQLSVGGAPVRALRVADPHAVALGNEPVRAGGEITGRVTSGGYGYSVERSIAYAYLPRELAEPGTAVEVEVFGDWIEAEVTRAALRPQGRAGAWPAREYHG